MVNRRDFIAKGSLALVAGSLLSPLRAAAAENTVAPSLSAPVRSGPAPFEIAAFEKHFFEKYTPSELAQTCDEMDLGVELTLRPEGHINPAHAAQELPIMVAALAERKRRILFLATSFVRPDEPHLETALKAARDAGIRYYRHRGYSYRRGVSIKSQLAEFKRQAREFAAISKEFGLTALYQNHSGANAVGAAVWDLDAMLDDIDPRYFGVALDTRHLQVELGESWPSALRMISPRIQALYVKSFVWQRDHPVETSLADGIVSNSVIDQVLADHPRLPVCLHNEYLKLEPVPFAARAATVDAFRRDADILRHWLKGPVQRTPRGLG